MFSSILFSPFLKIQEHENKWNEKTVKRGETLIKYQIIKIHGNTL